VVQTLTRNWWLLALCGVFEAIASVVYFIMGNQDGPLTFLGWHGAVALLGKVTLAAGACTIAAGVWRSKEGTGWLLVPNGLALGAFGLICLVFVRYGISFRTIALLIILMAVSLGILEFLAARRLRRRHHAADGWFLDVAGAASIGFASAFFALGFHWVKIEPGSHSDFGWLGAYFCFSAICKFGLGWRLHSRGLSQPGLTAALPPLGNPRPAH
jgi:uncharacterized membrane protein HdeD (DUF308 family)